MNNSDLGIQRNSNSRSVSAQARFLMSERRHKSQHRQQSMLQRTGLEVGIDIESDSSTGR